MADMVDWRSWSYARLGGSLELAIVGVPIGSIYGAGSLEGKPASMPFIVITFGEELADIRDDGVPTVASQYMTLWAHDEPGDYLRIDAVLEACKLALVGQVAVPGGIVARWEGNSGDLSDDRYGTIVRNSEYRLIGRK